MGLVAPHLFYPMSSLATSPFCASFAEPSPMILFAVFCRPLLPKFPSLNWLLSPFSRCTFWRETQRVLVVFAIFS